MGWPVFDRIRALFARNNLYNADQLLQNQPDITRLTSVGDFVNTTSSLSILEQSNLQINRLERYKDFDQMDQVGEITLALDLYADESSISDPERKHTMFVRSKFKKVKEALDELFYDTILIDNKLRSLIRYLCKYGDCPFEIVPTANRDGVARIKHLNIYNFNRVETRQADLVGFFHQDDEMGQPQFFHPWQIMHLRLTSYENIYSPYGVSILDGSRKAFKQLRLMEDAAIVYRLQRAPERRVFKIPVGNITPREIPGYMEQIVRHFKRKKIFDNPSGDITERWNPQIQDDDFWMPIRPDGVGPSVETLPGAENLDQIADIEYFKKKMVAALKIPFSRVGMGEMGEDAKQSLSQVAPEFSKAVQWIQQEVAMGLKKVALVHLALKGFNIEEMSSFDIGMTASSAIDELYRIETWKSRAAVIKDLQSTSLFTNEWLISRFTDMSEDEIVLMQTNMENQISKMGPPEGGGGGGMGGGGGEGGLPPMGGGGGGGEMGGGLMDALGLENEPGQPADAMGPEAGAADMMGGLGEQVQQDINKIVNKNVLNEMLDVRNLVKNYRREIDNAPKSRIKAILQEGELDGLEQNTEAGKVVIESFVVSDLEKTIEDYRKILQEERNKPKNASSEEITVKDIPK